METNETNQNTPTEPITETATPDTDNPELYERVNAIIEEIKPYIQSDGGNIELVKLEDNIVYVRLFGACIGCPSSMITLKHGVEARIREELPQIEEVEMV